MTSTNEKFVKDYMKKYIKQELEQNKNKQNIRKDLVFIFSKESLASMNVFDLLKNQDLESILNDEIKLDDRIDLILKKQGSYFVLINKKCIYDDLIDVHINNYLKLNNPVFIFVTTHKSENSGKVFTVHTPGNFNDNKLGGKPRTLSIACPLLMTEAYFILKKNNNLDYQNIIEATHHGPLLNYPSFFMEIGSSETEWQDKEAGKVMLKSILDLINENNKNEIPKKPVFFGIGGLHHAPRFTKQLNEFAFSHIAAKYNQDYIDEEMIRQALLKSTIKPDFVFLDWKGLSQVKYEIIEILNKLGINFKKIK